MQQRRTGGEPGAETRPEMPSEQRTSDGTEQRNLPGSPNTREQQNNWPHQVKLFLNRERLKNGQLSPFSPRGFYKNKQALTSAREVGEKLPVKWLRNRTKQRNTHAAGINQKKRRR